MKIISFVIPITPLAKKEDNSFAMKTGKINSKTGESIYSSRHFKNNEQRHYERQIMAVMKQFAPSVPFEGAVVLGVKIYVPMPGYILNSWKREPAEKGIIRPDKKPDVSNYMKNIEDCMTKLGYWHDDGQIIQYDNIGKYYSEKPRWEIKVIETWQPNTLKEYKKFIADGFIHEELYPQPETDINEKF
jgi:Holliday junction resolvase RusA-like endonuclease